MSSKHIKLKIWFQSHCRAQQVCPGVRLCVFQCTNNMCMRGQVLAALWAAMFSDWQVKIANFILWFHLGCSRQLWNHDCCFGWEGSDAVIGSTIKANKKEVNWALQVFDSVYLQAYHWHVSSVILGLFEKHIGSHDMSAPMQVPWSDGCKDLLRKVLPASFYWSVDGVLGFCLYWFIWVHAARCGLSKFPPCLPVSLSWLLVAMIR